MKRKRGNNGGGWPKGRKRTAADHPAGIPDLELRLAVFQSVAEPGRCYSHRQIAAACDCSHGLIWLIEKQAIAKLQRAAAKRGLLARRAA